MAAALAAIFFFRFLVENKELYLLAAVSVPATGGKYVSGSFA